MDLRRAAVTLGVVAAHIALIIMMSRSAGHSVDVVDTTLFALPINPEDRPREPMLIQKLPIPRASERAPGGPANTRKFATEQHIEPLRGVSSPRENDTLGGAIAANTGAAIEPPTPIDWHAEIDRSAHALEQHDNIESGQRPLAGPKQPALSAAAQKPACPYEKCEPGWGENLGIFKPSLHSKAGRIETIPSDGATLSDGSQNTARGEAVLWINNWCYNILVSPDPQRQGMAKCFFPLGKTAATRGDLLDPMDKSRPPQSHYNDAPWISYGLSLGASPRRTTR